MEAFDTGYCNQGRDTAVAAGLLSPADGAAISLWIISMSMAAAAGLFLIEALALDFRW